MDPASDNAAADRLSARAFILACCAWLLAKILLTILLVAFPALENNPALSMLLAHVPLFVFALPTAFLAWRPLARRVGWRALLGLATPAESPALRWLLPLVCSLPLLLVGEILTKNVLRLWTLCHLPPPPPQFPFLLGGSVTPVCWLVMAFCSVILAPLGEEIFFRALAPRALQEVGNAHPVMMAAVIFALMHLLPHGIPTLTLFGLVCSWRFQRGGLLSACMLHAMYNAWIFAWWWFVCNCCGE